MGQCYQKNKVHIYNWVNKNRERYNELCKIKQKRYLEWKRIQKIFLNILL